MPTFFTLAMLFLMSALGTGRDEAVTAQVAPQGDAPADADAGAASFTSYQARIVLPQNAQGYDQHEIRGQPCAEGYTRGLAGAVLSGSGLCAVEGWASEDPRDCRVQVHLREEPEQSGVCMVTVYEARL
ncbi:MAG: hypothetical protein QM820_10710 [Minicystis sp.]